MYYCTLNVKNCKICDITFKKGNGEKNWFKLPMTTTMEPRTIKQQII